MITAHTIMSENVITVSENATIEEATKRMIQKEVSTLLVTKNKLPIASIGKKEIVAVAQQKNARSKKVKEIMNTNFIIIDPFISYRKIDRLLRSQKIKRCPVVHNNKLVGIVTETDVINTERDFTKNERIKQDVTLVVFGLVTALFLFLFSPVGQSMIGLA